jgi:hypothetical protein
LAAKAGKETDAPERIEADGAAEDGSEGGLNSIPELMRRVVAAGLSGFFLTEEAIRKAVGDTLPRDWSDFALEQGDRTRSELIERLSVEIGRSLQGVDVADVLARLLAGSTIEVHAEIRLKPDRKGEASALKIDAKGP